MIMLLKVIYSMAGRMVQQVKQRVRVHQLGPADTQLLGALAEFEFLTAVQLARLFYKVSPANRIGVQRRLTRLYRERYVERGEPERPLRGGSVAYVYCLSQKGRRVVEGLGLRLPPRFRPSEWNAHTNSFWAHAVACGDVYIAAELLARTHSTLSLDELVLERAFRRLRSSVVLGDKRRVVIPDGWLRLRETAGRSGWLYPILLELDRGTERQAAWREKIRALLAWIDGRYEDLFGLGAVTIAVLTTSGEHRALSLKAWTEAELTSLGREQHGAWFRLAGVVPAEVSPDVLFLSPICLVPFREAPEPLISLGVVPG